MGIIKGSVGLRGQNDGPDVLLIQLMLNNCGLKLNPRLKEDGKCGRKTIDAVMAFQKQHCRIVDGRIDPDGASIRKLSQLIQMHTASSGPGALISMAMEDIPALWKAGLQQAVHYLTAINGRTQRIGLDSHLRGNLEFALLVATIYGEAGASSETAWKAIAFVIKNRVGKREWAEQKSITDIITKTGFDAYTHRIGPYVTAEKYMKENGAHPGNNARIERMITVLTPVYLGKESDFTANAVLYYSPRAQAELHKKNPAKWAATPKWNFSKLTEVRIPGMMATDDFKFYKYT